MRERGEGQRGRRKGDRESRGEGQGSWKKNERRERRNEGRVSFLVQEDRCPLF
jgi:hypothetical protein